MKFVFTISLLALAVFSSCEDSDERNPGPLETFNIYDNYQIAGQVAGILPGNDFILHYHYADPGELLAADAGVVQDLFIQVPNSFRETPVFNIIDQNIPDLNIIYTLSCFCAPIESVMIKSINLEGRDTGNEILIFGTVELEINSNGNTNDDLRSYTELFQFNGAPFRESIFKSE